MSDNENLEIRVLLIGEAGVGKKSMISRFKILNASQTIEGGKNKDIKGEETKNEMKESKSFIETFFSNKKYPSKEEKRELKKLMTLINFSKILTISNFNIEFQFFPISSADNIEVGDKINEEDEALKEHKMKFDNIKTELEKIVMKPPSLPNAEVKLLFLFLVDLGDFNYTFEKIKIYYEELNKYMNIDRNHFKVLIGNKVDVKDIDIDREALGTFTESFGFNYYEVSTKMFFNFEKFFEKLFFDVFEETNPSFSTNYFKERFNYIMTYRPTFTRSERASMKPLNNNPGPQEYNSNVYNFNNEEVKPVFGKDRFKKKIFVNKKGPVFDFKKEVFMKKHTQKSNKPVDRNESKRQQIEEKEDFETAEKKKRLKEEMFGHNPGFSLGVKPSSLKLRKKRKEEYKQMMRNFENIFDLDNITSGAHGQKSPRPISTDSSREAVLKRKQMIMQQRVEKLKQKSHSKIRKISQNQNEENLPQHMRHLNTTKKNKSSEESEEEPTDKKDYKKYQKSSPERKIRARSHRVVKKDPFIVPGPASYDIRGKIDISKGFTFGGRYGTGEKKNNYGPGYIYLESDIDAMLKQPKFAFKKSFAPRFKEPVIETPGDIREIQAKLNFMQENKLHEMNKNFYKVRDLHRKREEALIRKAERDDMKLMKIQETILNKYEKENFKRINKGLPPLDHNTINYNLVEESAPQYSIKGRYEKGFLGIQENYEDPTKLHGLEQSVSYLSKNLTKNLNPLPKYATVKPNLPSYSIPKAERFPTDEYVKMPGPNAYFADNFGEIETKPYGQNKFMGVSKREKDFVYSEIPGPGYYKIPGFTDTLLREAEKRNNHKFSNLAGSTGDMEHKHMGEMMDMLDDMNYSGEMNEENYRESAEVSMQQ